MNIIIKHVINFVGVVVFCIGLLVIASVINYNPMTVGEIFNFVWVLGVGLLIITANLIGFKK